jgi:hypothetical protein
MSARSIAMIMVVMSVVFGATWLDVQYFAANPELESRHDAGQAQTAARLDGYLR